MGLDFGDFNCDGALDIYGANLGDYASHSLGFLNPLPLGSQASRGSTVMTPITGGSSHLSQHAIERAFGLGDRLVGRIEVLWPGGVKNRLHGVRHGERLKLPEIPCSFDTEQPLHIYARCVTEALNDLRCAGTIDRPFARRLFISAVLAYLEG